MSSAPFRLTEPVSILMPIYNEADIIEEVIEEWMRDVVKALPAGSEFVFDDASTDETPQILARLATRYPQIRVNHAARDGFFNAAMRLYGLARCPLIFFTDSDGQYVPREFWRIAEHIGANDMVHGAKRNRKDPMYRIRASAIFNWLLRRMFGSRAIDANSAFRLIRRPVLDAVVGEIHCLRMLPNTELYIRAERRGFRIHNVPVEHRLRPHGTSRSLPATRFAAECWRAFVGMLRLKRELDARGPGGGGHSKGSAA